MITFAIRQIVMYRFLHMTFQRRDDYKSRMVTYIKNLGVNSNETEIKMDVDDAFQFEVDLAKVRLQVIGADSIKYVS